MKKRCDHDRSATIADSPLSGAHLQDSQWWSSGIYNHAAAVTLGRTWICRGFVVTGCMPPAANCDGGLHGNVDVRDPRWWRVSTSIGAAVVVASRSSLSRSVHDTLLRLMRSPVSHWPGCCSRHVLVERHIIEGELDFNKTCSIPKVVDRHANVWHWVTADWGVSAMAVVNATGWPSSQ